MKDTKRPTPNAPARDEEPTADELAGESEYSFRAANAGERRMTTMPHGGPPIEDDLSLDPEDLGRHALEEATQDPHPINASAELPPEELVYPLEPTAEEEEELAMVEEMLGDDLREPGVTAPRAAATPARSTPEPRKRSTRGAHDSTARPGSRARGRTSDAPRR
jgi:hypothetical protein